MGESRHLSIEADRRRQELHATNRGQAGSSREDGAALDAAGLFRDQGALLRRGRCANRGDEVSGAAAADREAAIDRRGGEVRCGVEREGGSARRHAARGWWKRRTRWWRASGWWTRGTRTCIGHVVGRQHGARRIDELDARR